MKVIYRGYLAKEVKPFSEWDSEVQDAVKMALELVEGRNGFKTHNERWGKCELIITIGHNIYTTSIEIRPPERLMFKRKSSWHNGYAYLCNGVFWTNCSGTKVELI